MAKEDIIKYEFKRGESGNPNGRPKLPDLKEAMQSILNEGGKDGVTALETILKRLRKMAADGNLKAIDILLDRAYGKAKQQIDVTSQDEKITVPTIIFTDANKNQP